MRFLSCGLIFFVHLACLGQTQWQIQRSSDSIYILKNGQKFLPTAVTEVSAFSEGKAWVSFGGRYAYLDTSGQFITDTSYDIVFPFIEGFAIVGRDSLYGAINDTGEEITPCLYEFILPFKNKFAVAKKDGYWGLLDSTGSEILEPAADAPLIRMENDCWAMKYREKWGVIDKTGFIVYPFLYDCILKDGSAFIEEKKVILKR